MPEHVNPDAPGNINHLRNVLDMGAHEFFERDHDHSLDGLQAVETTAHEARKDFTHEAVETREQIGKVWNTGQLAVTSTPQLVCQPIDGQRNIMVRNMGASPVYIGPNAGAATSWSGFLIDAGAAVPLDIAAPVWASCASGNTSVVCYVSVALGSLS